MAGTEFCRAKRHDSSVHTNSAVDSAHRAAEWSIIILHAVRNEAVNSRSRAPALERTALEAPASSDSLSRQEPREQCVPRQEPRNKDINSGCVK